MQLSRWRQTFAPSYKTKSNKAASLSRGRSYLRENTALLLHCATAALQHINNVLKHLQILKTGCILTVHPYRPTTIRSESEKDMTYSALSFLLMFVYV